MTPAPTYKSEVIEWLTDHLQGFAYLPAPLDATGDQDLVTIKIGMQWITITDQTENGWHAAHTVLGVRKHLDHKRFLQRCSTWELYRYFYSNDVIDGETSIGFDVIFMGIHKIVVEGSTIRIDSYHPKYTNCHTVMHDCRGMALDAILNAIKKDWPVKKTPKVLNWKPTTSNSHNLQ